MAKFHFVSKEREEQAGLEGLRVVEGSNPVDNVVRFEVFKGLPVVAALSWGKAPGLDAPLNFSTSQKFSDPDIENRRTAEFLRRVELPGVSDLVLVRPIYPPDPETQILYVS